ncbi:hypothetical protein ACXIU3_23070 [Vibrio parahaemolyticus]
MRTVGYTSGLAQITGKIPTKDLLDVELGIKDSIEIELLEYNHLRFDIPLPHPYTPAKIELLSNEYAASIGLTDDVIPDNEELLLCANDDSLPISLSGRLRVSSQSALYGVYAFDSDYFKLVIEESKSFSVRVTFYWDKLLSSNITIDELRHQLNVASILFNKDEKKFGFFSLDEGQCDRTFEQSDGADMDNILDLLSILDNIEQLMKVLSIRLSTPVSPRGLFTNMKEYKTILKILFNNDQQVLMLSKLEEVNSGV